jgi:hypothetical protein
LSQTGTYFFTFLLQNGTYLKIERTLGKKNRPKIPALGATSKTVIIWQEGSDPDQIFMTLPGSIGIAIS